MFAVKPTPLPAQSSPRLRLSRLVFGVLVAAALIVLLVAQGRALVDFFNHARIALEHPHTLNYGEGPLLDQALRLARGQSIYSPDLSSPPYTIANYPPLYPLVQVPFIERFGAAFWYGRLISVASIVVTAACIGLTVWSIGRDWLAGLAAALTLPAIPYIFHWSTMARIDSLALALSWLGLLVIVRWRGAGWSLFVSALLLTAAAYTRQTYLLAAPLAAFAWLWGSRERARALLFIVCFGSLVLAAAVVLIVATRGGFFYHIITANINALDQNLVTHYLNEMARHLPIFLGAAVLYLFLGALAGRRMWWIAAPYTLGAVIVALTVSKVGSDVNYFYELSAAFCLVMGAYLVWAKRYPLARAAILLLLAAGVWMATDLSESAYFPILTERVESQAQLDRLIDFIRETDAPILADEHMGLLALHDKPIYIQPFEMSQLANAGIWDQTPFLDDLRNGTYPFVLLYQPYRNPSLRQERWTREMLREINNHYRPLFQSAETTVYQFAGR